MKTNCILLLLVTFMSGLCHHAHAGDVIVSGKANPYLADPNNIPGGNPLDGTIPPSISVAGLSSIRISATGSFDNNSFSPSAPSPDGFPSAPANAVFGAQGGISSWSGLPNSSLAGVFLDPTNVGAAPPPISNNTNFSQVAPSLGQVFFMGDGLTGTGTGSRQEFIVPTGATRLYFAAIDGNEWRNNSGSVTVSFVPEPSGHLIACGIAIAMTRLRRRSRV